MTKNTDSADKSTQKSGFAGMALLVSDIGEVVSPNDSSADVKTESVASNANVGPVPSSASESCTPTDSALGNPAIDSAHGLARPSTPDRRPWSVVGDVTKNRVPDKRHSQLLRWALAFVIPLAALIVIFSIERPKPSTQLQPSASAAPVKTETPPVYVVAAVNANLRDLPSTRSKVIGTLKRGAQVLPLEMRDGFIRQRGDGDKEGWVSSEVVIERADYLRLKSSSVAEYIAVRERVKPIDTLIDFVKLLSPHVSLLLSQIQGGFDEVATTIGLIEHQERPSFQADTAAGLWFSLAARAAADAGDHAEAIQLATAAVYADPLRADYHTAMGFSALAAGDREALSATALILPALAPGATNTWVVVGVNAALSGKPEMAKSSLQLALVRSRNMATTVRVLRGIASRSDDPAVDAAVTSALAAVEESKGQRSAPRSN